MRADFPPVINRAHVEERTVSEGDIAFGRRRLAAAAGAARIGASLYAVPAGARQMPVHVHGDEEEIFFVLSGHGCSWQGGEACAVRAGDAIVHRPNGKPHTFLAGEGGIELLAFASGSTTSITYLPRARVMWCGPRWVPLESPHPFRAEGLAGALEPPEPGDRPANVVALADVEPWPIPGAELRRLGHAAGAVLSGLNHVTLGPGAAGSRLHCHSLEEELFYVLAGAGTVTLGGEEHALAPGDVVARPASSGVAHRLRGGERGLTYLAYGTREPGDSVYYPEAGEVLVPGLGVRLSALPGPGPDGATAAVRPRG